MTKYNYANAWQELSGNADRFWASYEQYVYHHLNPTRPPFRDNRGYLWSSYEIAKVYGADLGSVAEQAPVGIDTGSKPSYSAETVPGTWPVGSWGITHGIGLGDVPARWQEKRDLKIDSASEKTERPRVARRLTALADLFERKNAQYGDAYKRFGTIMMAFYPEGKTLSTAQQWSEMACFMNIVANLNRHAAGSGPSEDNLGDMSVYAMMLEDVAIPEKEGE